MKPNWFYILLSTASADRYGSAIREDVQALSGGAVRLWPATLYGSLEELTDRGWLMELDGEDAPATAAGRERYYRLTPEGRTALEAEAERYERLAGAVRQRLAEG